MEIPVQRGDNHGAGRPEGDVEYHPLDAQKVPQLPPFRASPPPAAHPIPSERRPGGQRVPSGGSQMRTTKRFTQTNMYMVNTPEH
eukprot:1183113-Prorocentrum_minimum.AAC.1